MTWIDPRPLLLGHRGAGRGAYESTLRSFARALEQGCDGFEFDLRATRDGKLIVCHDQEFCGREVGRSDYADLTLGARSGRIEPDNDIPPSLDAVLARFGGRAFLDMELKVAGLERAVATAINTHTPLACVISSFLPEVLESFRSIAPRVPLGYICDRARLLPHWRELPCEVVVPHWQLTSRELVAEAHARAKKLFVWCVNSAGQMRRFAGLGVDGIISDNTALLGRVFRREPVRRSSTFPE